MLDTIKKWFPVTYVLFLNYRVGDANVLSKGLKIIKSMINRNKVSY